MEEDRSKLVSGSKDSEGELNKLRLEVVELRRESTRLREECTGKKAEVANLNDRLYKADNDNRDLRAKLQELEREQKYLKDSERERNQK